jgi:hypothetical protein
VAAETGRNALPPVEDIRFVGRKALRSIDALIIDREARIVGDLVASVTIDAVKVPSSGYAGNIVVDISLAGP